jgi:hypothetical protein
MAGVRPVRHRLWFFCVFVAGSPAATSYYSEIELRQLRPLCANPRATLTRPRRKRFDATLRFQR